MKIYQGIDWARKEWEGDDPIRIQHQIFLDVLREYQHSRWPWVRWMANRMQLDIIVRIPSREKR